MKNQALANPVSTGRMTRTAEAIPPHAWFCVSAVFHYLGPSFAVLLFPVIGVLGGIWFGVFTPTEGAGAGAALALLFAFAKGMRTKQLLAAIDERISQISSL